MKQLPEMIQWIPVTERKPDSDTTVLLFNPDVDEPVWSGYRDDNGDQWVYVDGMIAEPTHWAEQPRGPKSEQTIGGV